MKNIIISTKKVGVAQTNFVTENALYEDVLIVIEKLGFIGYDQ